MSIQSPYRLLDSNLTFLLWTLKVIIVVVTVVALVVVVVVVVLIVAVVAVVVVVNYKLFSVALSKKAFTK